MGYPVLRVTSLPRGVGSSSVKMSPRHLYRDDSGPPTSVSTLGRPPLLLRQSESVVGLVAVRRKSRVRTLSRTRRRIFGTRDRRPTPGKGLLEDSRLDSHTPTPVLTLSVWSKRVSGSFGGDRERGRGRRWSSPTNVCRVPFGRNIEDIESEGWWE